jgi:hypothetical protein
MEATPSATQHDRSGCVYAVDGAEYSQASMLSANADDADLCEWLGQAEIGESFAAIADVRRVA